MFEPWSFTLITLLSTLTSNPYSVSSLIIYLMIFSSVLQSSGGNIAVANTLLRRLNSCSTKWHMIATFNFWQSSVQMSVLVPINQAKNVIQLLN